MTPRTPQPSQPMPPASRSASSSLAPAILPSQLEANYYETVEDIKTPLIIEHTIERRGSPTPSEQQELKAYDATMKKIFRKESWKNKHFLITIAVGLIFIAIVVVISVWQDDVLRAFTPAATWVQNAPVGWLIPVVLIIVLSIPPLFGAEIVQLLCGYIYGLWLGFLIVCVGMIIGEIITFFMFRSCLRSRAEKIERSNSPPRWVALARVIREGGFLVVLVVRYSAFPTHITTALFATCGVTFMTFFVSLVLSLPHQLSTVYFGAVSQLTIQGYDSSLDSALSIIVLVVTIVVTIITMYWIQSPLMSAGLTIIRERRTKENAEENI